MGNVDVPIPPEVKYLGMHLDRRLAWAKHMKTKSETNALATWKINTVNRKQIPPIQSNNQTSGVAWLPKAGKQLYIYKIFLGSL
jgi:hypothetical protein